MSQTFSYRPPHAGKDAAPSESYAVGYCKPPTHSRFKKGKSGNPAGRQKRQQNLKAILLEVLLEPQRIQVGGRTRTVSRLEAMSRRNCDDPKTLLALLKLYDAMP